LTTLRQQPRHRQRRDDAFFSSLLDGIADDRFSTDRRRRLLPTRLVDHARSMILSGTITLSPADHAATTAEPRARLQDPGRTPTAQALELARSDVASADSSAGISSERLTGRLA
jgi:hypothetical protein